MYRTGFYNNYLHQVYVQSQKIAKPNLIIKKYWAAKIGKGYLHICPRGIHLVLLQLVYPKMVYCVYQTSRSTAVTDVKLKIILQ